MILLAAVLMASGLFVTNTFAGGGGYDPCADGVPNAYFTVSPDRRAVGESFDVTMDGSYSVACDTPIVDYQWDFGDGTTASETTTVSHQYGVGTFNPTLTITDEAGLTHTYQYYYDIIVKADNSAPVFNDFTMVVPQGETVEIDINPYASDPDGDELVEFHVIDGSSNYSGSSVKGYYNVQPSGSIKYNASSSATGTDTLEIGVRDGFGGEDTSTVTVQIDPRLTGFDDSAETYQGEPVTIDILANDFSYQDRPFEISYEGWSYYGTVTNNGDGTVTFTPHSSSFVGTTTFEYSISASHDGNYYYSKAVVTVEVSTPPPPPNQAPVANDDDLVLDEDSSGSVNILANDYDEDGDSFTAAMVNGPVNGTATLATDGTLSYTPKANYYGGDTVTYELTDSEGNTSTGTVNITVNAVNDAPVANDDTAVTDEDTSVTVTVLDNDFDVENGSDMWVGKYTNPQNGAIVVNADRTITYTPNANFNGQDSFTYRVIDSGNIQAIATVSIVVNSVNDAPVASFTGSVNNGGKASFDASGSSDVDGEIVSYQWDFGDGNTATTSSSSVNHKYRGKNGSYQVTLTVTDSDGATTTYSKTVGS